VKKQIDWSLVILSAVIVLYTIAMIKTRSPKELVNTPTNVVVVYNTGGAEKVDNVTMQRVDDEYVLHLQARPLQVDSLGTVKQMVGPQIVRIPLASVKKIAWEAK